MKTKQICKVSSLSRYISAGFADYSTNPARRNKMSRINNTIVEQSVDEHILVQLAVRTVKEKTYVTLRISKNLKTSKV